TGIKFGEFHRVAKIAANIWDHIYSQKSHTKDMTSNQSSKKKIKLGIKEKIPSKLETESSLEEENNDINANEGLPEPYILIIQNTMDLSHSNFQDLDDNDENRSEYLSDEENVLANDEYYEEEEEYNSNELASSFMTALHNS
ncbi:1736_t:CDS:2, partial [Entrophospora sp. SA101]